MSNDTESGLALYLHAGNPSHAFYVAKAPEYDMVGVSKDVALDEVAPFGDMKASGQIREGLRYGIQYYLEIKQACLSA